MNDQMTNQALSDDDLDQIAGGSFFDTLADQSGKLANNNLMPSSMQNTMKGISSIASKLSGNK